MKRCSKCEIKYQHNNRDRWSNVRERNAQNHYKNYTSYRWRSLRDSVLRQFKGLCVYSFYEYGKVVTNEKLIVHHIQESSESNFFDRDNLIVVSDCVHRTIHDVYDNGSEQEVIELKNKLRKYRCKFLEEMSI